MSLRLCSHCTPTPALSLAGWCWGWSPPPQRRDGRRRRLCPTSDFPAAGEGAETGVKSISLPGCSATPSHGCTPVPSALEARDSP